MRIFTTLMVLGISTFSMTQTISTEAPSVSAGGTTVGKNKFQIESSLTTSFSDNFLGPIRTNSIFNLFRYGITERFEVRLTNGYFYQKDFSTTQSGFNTVNLGAKYSFRKDPSKKTQVAIIGQFDIPKYEGNQLQGGLNLAVSHSLWEHHSIGYNLGYATKRYSTSSTSTAFNTVNASLIYAYSVLPKLTVFGEVYLTDVTSNISFPDTRNVGYDFGFMYLIKDNIQLDYVFGSDLEYATSFHSIGFNILFKSGNKNQRVRSVPLD